MYSGISIQRFVLFNSTNKKIGGVFLIKNVKPIQKIGLLDLVMNQHLNVMDLNLYIWGQESSIFRDSTNFFSSWFLP